MKMALGALFRAELSKELEALGFSSYRPILDNDRTASWFELDVVPPPLLSEFSKRRLEIEKWLRKTGLSGAKAAEMAALKTRQAKEDISRERLFDDWQSIGKAFGFSAAMIDAHRAIAIPIRDLATESSEATERALVRITQERAHFSELELLRFTAEEAQTRGLGINEVRSTVRDSLKQTSLIVPLSKIDNEAHFTTPEMLWLEKQILEAAERARGNASHQVSSTTVTETLRRFPTADKETHEAFRSQIDESEKLREDSPFNVRVGEAITGGARPG
jgi:hypothetical protein